MQCPICSWLGCTLSFDSLEWPPSGGASAGQMAPTRMFRYCFPEIIQTPVVDMYDFDRVNQALLLGCALDFEIRRWRGTLAEAPALGAYARELARIRLSQAPTLMHGRFLDRGGARVEGADQPGVEYGVHDALDGSARSVVISNEGDVDAKVRVYVDGATGWVIDRPDAAQAVWGEGREITVAPMRVAVVTVTR